jgi:hypothetical protein
VKAWVLTALSPAVTALRTRLKAAERETGGGAPSSGIGPPRTAVPGPSGEREQLLKTNRMSVIKLTRLSHAVSDMLDLL